MNLLLIAQTLTDICEHSTIVTDKPLSVTIIVNPSAGGYKSRNKWKAHSATLEEYRDKAQSNPKRPMYKFANMLLTEGPGSAAKITKLTVEKAIKNPDPFYLLISAGGDAIHREVMLTLFESSAEIRNNFAVLRLPMGNGNDGADCPALSDALELLINPVKIELSPTVRLIPSSKGEAHKKGPFHAFNICSMGFDAYVTYMTNKMKMRKKARDAYKLWLDFSALFYDWSYKVDKMDVIAKNENGEVVQSIHEKLLLVAMGISGDRTYGSQQKILPDFRNVCAAKKMSLLAKLAIKKQVSKGTHTNNKNAILFSAKKLEITGKHNILAQVDGVTILLKPEDFPVIMEITEPAIPILVK